MAIVRRRTVMVLLAAIVLVAIALRYPMVEHERYQSDSYFIHTLSQSIVDSGEAKWTFNTLSYFGYYPESYSSGVPFLLAEVSLLTGQSVEVVILMSGMLMGALLVLGAFLLARQFVLRPQYALLAALLVTLGSRFVDTSYWNGSARAPFVVFMVIAILVFVRYRSTRQTSLILIGAFLAIGCLAMHHMAVLFILVGLAYVAGVVAVQYLLPRIRIRKRSVAAAYVIGVGTAILLLSFGFFEFFGMSISSTYSETSLFSFEPKVLSAISNMGASYANQVGIVLIFAAIGFPLLLLRSRVSFENIFLMGLILLFIPMLGGGLYVSMVLSVFVSILGVVAIQAIYNSRKSKRLVIFSVLILLALSVILPVWSIDRWNGAEQLTGDKVEVDSQTFSDATYVSTIVGEGYAISNTDVQAMRLGALGGTQFLRSGILGAINGDITSEDIEASISWSKEPFPKNLYSWYSYSETPYIDLVVLSFVVNGVRYVADGSPWHNQPADDYFASHPRLFVVVDNQLPAKFVNVWGSLNASLPHELLDASWSNGPGQRHYGFESYMLYQSSGVTVYVLELPT